MRKVALLMLVVLPVALYALAHHGKPQACDVANDLVTARMLTEADVVLDRGTCAKDVGKKVGNHLTRATVKFELAHVSLAEASAARERAAEAAAKKPQPDTVARDAALAEARAADTAAIWRLRDALNLDPFRGTELDVLQAAIGRVNGAGGLQHRCRLAGALVDAGLLDAAQQALGRLASAGRCAAQRTALAAERADAVIERRAAEHAARRDREEATWAANALAVRHDTAQADARDDLSATASDQRSWLDDAVHWVAGVPGWLKAAWDEILVAAVALALLALLVFHLLRYGAWRWPRVREAVAPDSGSSRVGRRIARLRVDVAAIEGGTEGKLEGADAAAILGPALEGPSRTGFAFDRMSPADDGGMLKSLTTVAGVVPHGPLVSALVDLGARLFAARTARVGGRLLPPDQRGAGIAMTVTRPDRTLRSQIVRARDFDPTPGDDPAAAWGRLVLPASVWVRQQLLSVATHDGADGRAGADAHPGAWRGVAYLEAGRAWAASGDDVRAGACYVRALACDGDLLEALNNLAVGEIRAELYDMAIEHLDQLYAALG